MAFPLTRLRRLRANKSLRDLVSETRLDPGDLIMPYFVRPGRGQKKAISSMPGHYQYSVDELIKTVSASAKAAVGGIILFGIPDKKDAKASGAYAKGGIVQTAITEVKNKFPDLVVIADLCLCEYTDHGHCGVIKNGFVDNDSTLELLARTAVSQIESGADIVAPSGMMDGQIAAIRAGLDGANREMAVIMAYAAKYASAFYGPFREAAESPPAIWRPFDLSDGSVQYPGGHPRSGSGRRGRRRHHHGQAGPSLFRRP